MLNHPSVNIEMYADDTVIFSSDLSPVRASKVNEEIMNRLYKWCMVNKLTINFKKTKHMMIWRHNNILKERDNLFIHVGGAKIDNVTCYHYLGIDLDNSLTYDKMLDCMFIKANRKLYMLKRIRLYISNYVANLVYKTHVLPMLDYADFMVDSGKTSKTTRLDNLHKRAVKLIDNKANHVLNDIQLLDLYGLEKLVSRREKHHLTLMYRLKDNDDLIEPYRANIELRNNNKIKFKIRTTKLTKVTNSPYYRGVHLWDQLNESTQRATTKEKFKQLLR